MENKTQQNKTDILNKGYSRYLKKEKKKTPDHEVIVNLFKILTGGKPAAPPMSADIYIPKVRDKAFS